MIDMGAQKRQGKEGVFHGPYCPSSHSHRLLSLPNVTHAALLFRLIVVDVLIRHVDGAAELTHAIDLAYGVKTAIESFFEERLAASHVVAV
jgi:hypothetical protein